MVMRVAVVGAGAAGLAALRRLTARPSVFAAVGLEQEARVSGTWVYTESVGQDKQGLPIHSSMYANLRTNLPKEVMAYPDFPFADHLPSFITHRQVDDYLNAFTDHFDIRKYIRFNTVVHGIRPVMSEQGVLWEVTTSGRHRLDDRTVEQFDAVLVCNGHYAIPLVPKIAGQEKFTGRIEHSHAYRHPESYAGLRVAILGSGSSGQDIALDLAPHAEQVFLCHRRAPLQSPLPANMTQKQGIRMLDGDRIELENGETLDNVHVLLLCTGYRYTFPFLPPECGVQVEDERVTPMYKHIIHTRLPSLSFIGLSKVVCPFPHFDCQVLFVLAALDGSMQLPSQVDMEADAEGDYRWRLAMGMPHRHAHHMGTLQWDYVDELARLAGFKPLPRVVQRLYDHVHDVRTAMLQEYKDYAFNITEPDTFMQVGLGTGISNGTLPEGSTSIPTEGSSGTGVSPEGSTGNSIPPEGSTGDRTSTEPLPEGSSS